jgi:hypothetical protein
MKVTYEWCIETYDEHEDIVDHHHSDVLNYSVSDLFRADGYKTRLVLIRDEGDEDVGVVNRYWAYVENGELPEYFTEEWGVPINVKVPQRFHKELEKFTPA